MPFSCEAPEHEGPNYLPGLGLVERVEYRTPDGRKRARSVNLISICAICADARADCWKAVKQRRRGNVLKPPLDPRDAEAPPDAKLFA
jgi:hypothetical protein